MKKKVEFKKTIIISCIVIIAISIVFECCLFYQYKVYTNNFNKKIELINKNNEDFVVPILIDLKSIFKSEKK